MKKVIVKAYSACDEMQKDLMDLLLDGEDTIHLIDPQNRLAPMVAVFGQDDKIKVYSAADKCKELQSLCWSVPYPEECVLVNSEQQIQIWTAGKE